MHGLSAWHPVKKRLTSGFTASALTPLVTVFVQLVTVPVLLKAWGVERYGEWLLLSAIPIYLSMTDMGFGSVAGNEMTMDVAAGDRQKALQTFQSTGMLVVAVSLLSLMAVEAAVRLLPARELLHLTTLTQSEIHTTLICLSVYSLLTLYDVLITAGYRCDGNFARGMVAQNGGRVAENLASVLAVLLGAGIVKLAFVLATMRAAWTCSMAWDLVKLSPWLRFGVQHVRRERIRNLFAPALAFMAIPAGNALSIQGMLLVVGVALGPVATTTFSTLRTLTRFGFQLSEVIKQATWPEFSVAFGRSDLILARHLHRVACQLSLLLSASAVVFLWLAGEALFHLWTHGRVVFERRVFAVLLCSVIASSLWSASSVVALASNSHARLAGLYLTATSVCVLAAFFLAPHTGIMGAALCLLLVDLTMCVYVISISISALRESPPAFFRSLLDPGTALSVIRGSSAMGFGDPGPAEERGVVSEVA